MATKDIHATLAHHEQQIANLDIQVSEVKRVVSSVDSKLDRLVSHQTQQAVSRPGQIFDYIVRGLQALFLVVCLVGAAATSIVYISSNANNTNLTLLNWRLNQVEAQKGATWQPSPVIVRPAK